LPTKKTGPQARPETGDWRMVRRFGRVRNALDGCQSGGRCGPLRQPRMLRDNGHAAGRFVVCWSVFTLFMAKARA